jgi:teichuronic acid biosynthesis glycosyltransferase TuaG
MLVSIVVPYYQCKDYIFQSVNSVINQTYKNWELIIIDDENSKSSESLLNKIKGKNKNIKIFSTKSNVGVGQARNLGIKKSKGKFVAFLDSDDYWHKNKIEKQIIFLEKKNVDICYTGYSAFYNNKIIYRPATPLFMDYYNFSKECPICCSSVLIKKKILNKFKFKNYTNKEDYELWLRITKKKINFFGLNEYLTFYRIRKGSLSSFHLSKIINAFKIYKKYYGFNLFFIFFCITRLYINALKKRFI